MSLTHHSYVLWGTDASVLPAEAQTIDADCVHIVAPAWGIAESRRLTELAQSRPVASPVRRLVAIADTLTPEAQNALLKLLEEPPATSVLYLVVPSRDRLLSTVLSRLQEGEKRPSVVDDTAWQTFKTQSVAERLAAIAAAAKAKDTAWQQTVLAAAVVDTAVPAPTRLLLDEYARTRGASRKMLLEEVALALAS